ncbi:MAG: alpha/beta hydrolase [Candidatus Cyclobacteriaceae bacterium M3_2C_046]
MMKSCKMSFFYSLILILFFSCPAWSQPAEIIEIWPGKVPGEEASKQPARVTENTSGEVTRMTDVTNPVLEVFPAPEHTNNGASVIICPGGGYHILAIDKEGYEVAEWLNSLGYTAFVLQYRVPQKQEGAFQDILRAVRLIRQQADQWDLDHQSIGVLGFSAGGNLAARASTRYLEAAYQPVDQADQLSARPDFAILIYPAYLDRGEGGNLSPDITITAKTPPVFLFVAANDKHASSSLVISAALRAAEIPVELHMVPEGGHGFGLRPGNPAAELWPELARVWLEKYGLAKP